MALVIGPKKASAKSSVRNRSKRSPVRAVEVHPADVARSVTGSDGKRRGGSGRAKLWARGIRALALDAGCTVHVARKAVQDGLDPLDILATAAWICERQKEHELAAGLRAMVRARSA